MYRITPVIKNIIIANVVVALLIHGSIYDMFVLNPSQVFGEFKIYQLITYQYLHSQTSIFHLFFNMLLLFFFGPELEERFGSRVFLIFYTIAGVVAGLAQYFISPASMVGASGSVMGVFTVFALLNPNRQIMLIFPPIPIKVKYMFLFYLIYDLSGAMNTGQGNGDNIAHLAHLGGAFAGFIFVKFFSSNYANNWRYQSNYSRSKTTINDLFEKLKSNFEQKETRHNNFSDVSKNEYSLDKIHYYRSEVDRLLDKINEVGYLKLSEEERKKLEEASDYLKKYDSN